MQQAKRTQVKAFLLVPVWILASALFFTSCNNNSKPADGATSTKDSVAIDTMVKKTTTLVVDTTVVNDTVHAKDHGMGGTANPGGTVKQ